tara:strand:- start:19321 stop:19962 length:642 start_codon:yes stop_codon:yes gene_type:complete
MAGDNWWEGLVAPAGGGSAKLSGAENVELSKSRAATEAGRDVFPALGAMYRVANRYPGGIPAVAADKVQGMFGASNQQTQDYQLFDTYAKRAAIAKAKLLAPVSNTDIGLMQASGANPTLKFQNNKELIGQEFGNASRQYFEQAFKQRFAARNHGLNGTDKKGRSYAEALADAMRTPLVSNLMQPPWKRRAASTAAPAAKGPAKTIDFNDLPD